MCTTDLSLLVVYSSSLSRTYVGSRLPLGHDTIALRSCMLVINITRRSYESRNPSPPYIHIDARQESSAAVSHRERGYSTQN